MIKIINKWLKIEEKCLYESKMIWTAGGITILGLEMLESTWTYYTSAVQEGGEQGPLSKHNAFNQ